jgi:hypothetical protein
MAQMIFRKSILLTNNAVKTSNVTQIYLRSCNACYYSIQNLLSSRLKDLSKIVKNEKDLVFFSVVLYGCETWFLTLREQYRLIMFANRVLSRIFGSKKDEIL